MSLGNKFVENCVEVVRSFFFKLLTVFMMMNLFDCGDYSNKTDTESICLDHFILECRCEFRAVDNKPEQLNVFNSDILFISSYCFENKV